jgi:hypothetical protein
MQGFDEMAVKYVACDGELFLTSMSDVYDCVTEDGTRVYMGTSTYPSKHYEEFKITTDQKVRNMLSMISIRNGAMSFTGFYDNGVFRFFDPSLRMGGAQDWRIVEAACGIDISKLLTNFSMTGSMGVVNVIRNIDKAFENKKSALLYFDIIPGQISKFVGIDEVLNVPGVVGYHQCHIEGDIIKGYGTSDNVAIRFIISCDTVVELKSSIEVAQRMIKIEDPNGKNLIAPLFDWKQLY